MTTKNKKRHNFFLIIESLKKCKLKLILIGIFIFIALITGIIVAAKVGAENQNIEKFDILSFGSNFWGRLFSMLLVALICFGCSFSKWLFPISLLFLSYRGYLLGVNITFIISSSGFSGVIAAILVIFPCQIIVLALMSAMYALLCKMRKECVGGCDNQSLKQRLLVMVVTLVFLVIVCVLESVLFAIFSPNLILIV